MLTLANEHQEVLRGGKVASAAGVSSDEELNEKLREK